MKTLNVKKYICSGDNTISVKYPAENRLTKNTVDSLDTGLLPLSLNFNCFIE